MASSDLNSVCLIGRLTHDAEVKYIGGSGTPVASISIAVNRAVKKGDQWESEASFFDVSYFGKAAEALKPYLTKGKQIAVCGSLRQERWEKDGQKYSKVSVVAQNLQLCGGSSSEEKSSGDAGKNGNFKPANIPAPESEANTTSSQEFPEDIPF